jgi:hypothetical protein
LLRHGRTVAAILALVCTPWPVGAQIDDRHVKAAFVLNFLKFVEWPPSPPGTDAADVVVLGDDDLARAIEMAAQRQAAGGRPLVVRAVRRTADIGAQPRLLFIAAAERDRLPVVLRQYEGRPVLTVGDGSGYGAAGVVLNFYTSDARIRFEANTTAAARAGLQISSHLLRLARIVG